MSIKGKIATINKSGIKPILEGLKNKMIPNTKIEIEAHRRAKICIGCLQMIEEPVDYLKIKDKKIPKVSEMMCNDCWCSIPLKIRQNKTLCKKWKDE